MERTHRLIVLLGLISTNSAMALTVSVTAVGHQICGNWLGGVVANQNGGVPPYSFLWNNGSTEQSQYGLPAGIYSVVVTDAVGTTATGQAEVLALNAYPYATVVEQSYCNGMQPFVVFWAGTENGMPPDPMTGTQHGPGPYTFQAPGYTTSYGEWPQACSWYAYYMVGVDAPAGSSVTVNYEDGSGCPGSFLFQVPQPISLPTLQIVDVTGSCSNGAIGSASLSINAPVAAPFRIRLKNGAHQPYSGVCDYLTYEYETSASHQYTGLAPGTYWVVSDVDVFGLREDIQAPCSDSISFVVPDLGTTCGLVSGRVHIDNNANCAYNSGENNVPSTVIEITPGPYYTTTGPTGTYAVNLPYGTYQFEEQHPVVEQSCPLNVTVAAASLANRNISCTGGMPLDVRVLMANGPARPGFEILYAIDIDNLTTATTGATTLTVQVDPALTFVSMTSGGVAAGNTYSWNLAMTSAFQHREVRLRMRVPPDVGLIGSTLTTTATLTTANTDVDLSNNTAISQQLVTGSFDPNDKLARTSSGSGTTYLIGQDEWIDYTIRFQNTGTDTAFNVLITDTLPATLDPATVLWGPTSHACTRSMASNGTLKFIFTNILLPDSNSNEPLSHGFVSFRIRPHQPVSPGTTFTNLANIYFDFNPPVITDPSVLTVASPGVVLSPRVLLGGPYVGATQRMNDALRASGLLPLTEPYTAMGYDHVGDGGGETATAAVFAATGDDAIVDWVVVELRNTNAPYAVIATRSALLQRDGDVTATNGTGPLAFDLPAGPYRIAIRHRNHLGCMTNTGISLGPTNTVVDFTTAATSTYGSDARASVGGRLVLWPGDGNADGVVKYAGSANDRDRVLVAIGGMVPTNVVSAVYDPRDIDLNGQIKYTGGTNDRDVILQSIGGVVPTSVRTAQLP
ncbi:MAG TPA: hypothetical protein PLL57_11395 [Flavobacteriales bacterium]|nr:hypothetical protein [Flavobacteriales bacterium]